MVFEENGCVNFTYKNLFSIIILLKRRRKMEEFQELTMKYEVLCNGDEK